MNGLKTCRLPPQSHNLLVHAATEKPEIQALREVLNEGHYLKAGRAAGHTLWQGIYHCDEESGTRTLVTVLCWGGAALRLRDRDTLDWLGQCHLRQSSQAHRPTPPFLSYPARPRPEA